MKNSQTSKTAEPAAIYPAAALNFGFFGIVKFSTTVALACLAAAIQSLRRDAAGFRFQISWWTLAALAVGAGASLLFWKATARSMLAVRLGIALLLMSGVGGFLYPLRFVPKENRVDIAIGLGVAICALSSGALLLWNTKRFFDADSATVETKKGR